MKLTKKIPLTRECFTCLKCNDLQVNNIIDGSILTTRLCFVLDGKITRHTKIRVIRDGIVIHTGQLGSLKRFKDDVKEVTSNYECGLNIDNFNDIKIGDIIEGYLIVEVAR